METIGKHSPARSCRAVPPTPDAEVLRGSDPSICPVGQGLPPPTFHQGEEGSILSGRRGFSSATEKLLVPYGLQREEQRQTESLSQASWPGCRKDLGLAEGLAR